jgi:uncharacterized membrane protein
MRPLASRAPDRALLVLTAVAATTEVTASIIRHVHVQSGFDLALADQTVWHYSRFEAPFSSILQKNILGDHFSPLVASLSPLYWLWSDPRMLLIAQALLISTSIIPVYLFAERRLGRVPALLLSAAYAVFWGVQVGALYDFHELAFAPLLVATAILLADRALETGSARHWSFFWMTILLLLLVKEDLAILVSFFGLYLLSRRELRHGIALVLVGIAWYEISTRVLIPHFASGMQYSHWTYQELGSDLPSAMWALIKEPWRVLTIGLGTGQRVQTILGLFAPFLFLSFGTRLFILAVPLLAERFLSTNTNFWVAHFHYSLTISPVLAMAAAAGLGNIAAYAHVVRRSRVVLVACATMLVVSLAITRFAASDSALAKITDPSFFDAPGYTHGAFRAIAVVPPAASLASDDYVLPHVSQRRNLRLIEPASEGRVSYLITDVLQVVCCGTGNRSYAAVGQVVNAQLQQMQPILYRQGWLVALRPPPGRGATNGVLSAMPAATAKQVAQLIRGMRAAYVNTAPCIRRADALFTPNGGCLASSLAAFRARVVLLDRALAQTRAFIGDGCADVARTADGAAHRLLADLRTLSNAAARGDRSGFSRELAATAAENANLDLWGALDRLPILCTPRTPRL